MLSRLWGVRCTLLLFLLPKGDETAVRRAKALSVLVLEAARSYASCSQDRKPPTSSRRALAPVLVYVSTDRHPRLRNGWVGGYHMKRDDRTLANRIRPTDSSFSDASGMQMRPFHVKGGILADCGNIAKVLAPPQRGRGLSLSISNLGLWATGIQESVELMRQGIPEPMGGR